MFEAVRDDIRAIRERDPAARSAREVALCYPGFHAVVWHRLSHALWRRGWIVTARCLSQFARLLTGIEIHPGARIGRRVFIDHGAGTVIGETAEVADDVTLYQGVTLGGVALAPGKRHPTVAAGVIIGAGAQVLGPITVGAGARIGANAVVVKDVAPGATMTGIPARSLGEPAGTTAFCAYGLDHSDGDPIAATLERLERELAHVKACLARIEGDAGRAAGGGLDIAGNVTADVVTVGGDADRGGRRHA